MTGLNRKTTSQLRMIGNLNRCFGIHLVRIMGIIKITKFYGDDGFIKGNPLVYQVTVSLKTKTSIVFISLDSCLIFPAITSFLKGKRQVEVIEID